MTSNFWNGKRVLITGGSGFVGRWVIRTLSPFEPDIRVIDLIPPQNVDPVSHLHVDLTDLKETRDTLQSQDPEVIIHLAGLPGVGASHQHPDKAFESNALATFNMLEAARSLPNLTSFVAVSSNHVYGEQEHFPTPETAPLDAEGIYAVTKLCGDVLARAYGKTYRLPVTIARITNSFGGDDHHLEHIITSSIISALRGERPIIRQSGRDSKGFLYIKDTAKGLVLLAEKGAGNPVLYGEAFNFVPDEPVTTQAMVVEIMRLAGRSGSPEIKNPEAAFEIEHLDNRKARDLLGWRPEFTLEEALKETITWYRGQRVDA